MADKIETVAVRFKKDISAAFGCKGDVYVNTKEQMAKLDAYIKKFKIQDAYEVISNDVVAAEEAARKVATTTKADLLKEAKSLGLNFTVNDKVADIQKGVDDAKADNKQ